VLQQLTALLGQPGSWLDQRVSIRRFGSGLDTRYQVEKANGGGASTPAPASSSGLTHEQLIAAILEVTENETVLARIANAVVDELGAALVRWGVIPEEG